jgi:hypothetical protein
MKEVKLLWLGELAGKRSGWHNYISASHHFKEAREAVENRLASLLNKGWQIAGTGGEGLTSAFVILVRER